MIVLGHLGLGDHLLTQGLVRAVWKRDKPDCIVIPCWERNLPSLDAMYDDLDYVGGLEFQSEADVLAYCQDAEAEGERVLRLGHYGKNFDVTKFDVSFYEQAGVPFGERWKGFRLSAESAKGYATDFDGCTLIHEDYERGYRVQKLPSDIPRVIFLKEASTIWEFVPMIQKADQLHFISSAPLILADSLELPVEQKRFVHRYARPGEALPQLRHQWTVLE